MNHLPLPYHADATRLFERVRHLPFAALLHSGDRSRPGSRFDTVAADPMHPITYDGGVLRIGDTRELTLRPLDVLGRHFANDTTPYAPHFRSGFIGYFGYALQHTFEHLPEAKTDPTGMPALVGGDYRWSVVTDHTRRTTTLWYTADVTTRSARKLATMLTGTRGHRARGFEIAERFCDSTSEADYRAAFEAVIDHIRAGDCYQINLARHRVARLTGEWVTASWMAYRRLIDVHPAQFAAYLATPHGCIVSVSPERFVRFSPREIETAPIKGTIARGMNAAQDRANRDQLRASGKDNAEHVMIVDLLRNDLGRICRPGSIRVADLKRIETLSTVHHLVSTIRGEPRVGIDAWQTLAATFPGGSVTGAPKVRAMQIINDLEPVGRSAYCGAIGYIDRSGSMDTNIAIRTLVFSPTGVHCWGGGGIVADSEFEIERAEIEHKIGRLLQAAARLRSSKVCKAS